MATSLATSPVLPGGLASALSSRRWETAEGVAIGVVVGGLLTYLLQHFLVLQQSTVNGRVVAMCPPSSTPVPLQGGHVDAVGTSGPGYGGVYETSIDSDGGFSMAVPPGLYVLAVRDASGQQTPPMVLTPRTQTGQLPIPQALELIGDVWSQVLVPSNGAVTVNLVVNC